MCESTDRVSRIEVGAVLAECPAEVGRVVEWERRSSRTSKELNPEKPMEPPNTRTTRNQPECHHRASNIEHRTSNVQGQPARAPTGAPGAGRAPLQLLFRAVRAGAVEIDQDVARFGAFAGA